MRRAPWRAALDLGIPTGGGTDATDVAAQSPWRMPTAWSGARNKAVIAGGKLADIAVLSDHHLDVPEERIKKITPDLTVNGGRIVHAAGRLEDLS